MKMKLSFVDLETGLLGASFVAIPIGLINLGGGWEMALMAGGIQWIYSLNIISFNTSLCRNLAPKNKLLAIMTPTLLTTGLTYALQTFIGSPEPFFSALYAFASALPSFIFMTYRFKTTSKSIFRLIMSKIKKS